MLLSVLFLLKTLSEGFHAICNDDERFVRDHERKREKKKKHHPPQPNSTQLDGFNGRERTGMLRLTPPWVLFGRVNLLTLLPSLSKIGQQHRVVVVRKSFFFFFYGPKFFFDPITSADVRAAHPLPRPPSCCFVDMFPITVDMIADKILWVGRGYTISRPPSYLLKLSHWFPVKFLLHVITSI